MNDTKTVKVTIKKMFRDCPKPSGWFGCFARVPGNDYDVKITGTTNIPLNEGMQLEAEIKPGKMGDYEIVSFQVVTKTSTGLVSYLSSFKNVSRETAKRIVTAFGSDAIDIIQNDPDQLLNIGLSPAQTQSVIKGLSEGDVLNKLRSKLPEFSALLIQRIIEVYKKEYSTTNPLGIIEKEPYTLLKVPGVSFTQADTVALRYNIAPDSYARVSNAIIYLLNTRNTGDLFVNLDNPAEVNELLVDLQKTIHLSKPVTEPNLLNTINRMATEPFPQIYIDTDYNESHLYPMETYEYMMKAYNVISNKCHEASPANLAQVTKDIMLYENLHQIKFAPEQKQAIQTTLTSALSIITGGPGRGKTMIIDCLTACAKSYGYKIVLMAPTGKASNKLYVATNGAYPTMTVDRLLATYLAADKPTTRNRKFELDMKYNNKKTLIVIDESSMLDLVKAGQLLTRIKDSKICFVGDIDQLPPIAPGYFFKDLIESGKVPCTKLITAYRNGGIILDNAEKINKNDPNLQYDIYSMLCYPHNSDDQEFADKIIGRYLSERSKLPNPNEVALLCPMKKGVAGVVNLNLILQNSLCPEATSVQPVTVRDQTVYNTRGFPVPNTIYGSSSAWTKLRIGDMVINTENHYDIQAWHYEHDDYWNGKPDDYDMGVFNGDVGKIIAYEPSSDPNDPEDHAFVIVQLLDGKIVKLDQTLGQDKSWHLGYALTVHKSQGCEYDTVIYVSPSSLLNMRGSGFATRNLIYTAVTRAKKRIIILGSQDSITACIKSNIPDYNDTFKDRVKTI